MSEDADNQPRGETRSPRVTVVPFKPDQVPSPSVRLEEDERHPVLVFGSSRSGKSTMIMSLINALEKAGREGGVSVSASFGRSFYAKRDARSDHQMQYARDFYETAAHNFISGRQALDSTQADVPFFVPIDLTVHGHEKGVVRIAILDSRGEWYVPSAESNVPMYQELKEDIVEVLKNYSHGVSIICVAPYSLSHDNAHDTVNSDAGLLAALVKYEEARELQDRHEDSFLFLLSKWDQVASPQRDRRFTRLMGADVVRELEERYGRSWDRFRSMPIGPNDWSRRCFMQYSSCSFVDGKPRIQPHLTADYLRYPRTLLNWLFGNARRYQGRQGDRVDKAELALFPDVLPPDPRLTPISERFLRWITR
jgi:hypothetical protein